MATDNQHIAPPLPSTTVTPFPTIGQRLRAVAASAQPALDRLDAVITAKLSGIPPERRHPAPATIAAPAAFHYALLSDANEVAELREMFENLLVSSMDRDTAASAHPAFVSMISQLTPDEARILKSIDQVQYSLIWINIHEPSETRSRGFRTLLGNGLGIGTSQLQQYVSNLERLGIVRVVHRSMLDHKPYEHIEEMIMTEFGYSRHELDRINTVAGTVETTPFGEQFLDTCVRARR